MELQNAVEGTRLRDSRQAGEQVNKTSLIELEAEKIYAPERICIFYTFFICYYLQDSVVYNTTSRLCLLSTLSYYQIVSQLHQCMKGAFYGSFDILHRISSSVLDQTSSHDMLLRKTSKPVFKYLWSMIHNRESRDEQS